MLKKTLFLLFIIVCTPVYATENATISIDSVQSLLKQGQVKAAIKQLRVLVEHEPGNYQAWFLLGVNQAEQSQFDDAIKSFHHVIELQPKLAEPHNNLAVIYNETGNYRAAVDALEISLKLKPDYVTAQENIADLYIKLAADAYRKVLAKKKSPVLQQRYLRLLNIRSDVPLESAVEQTGKRQTVAATTSKPSAHKAAQAARVMKMKPAVATSGDSTDLSQSKQDVMKAIEAWRIAWSNKDMIAYFAAYSDEFQYGERHASLTKWRDYKTWAMRKRSFIKIDVEHVVMTALAENVMKVELLQHFRSDSLNIDNRKEMLFRKGDAGWEIIYEASF